MGSISPAATTEAGYPETRLNKVRVYSHRGHYDYATVHSIIDSTFVSHVSFITKDEDGEQIPMNLPLTAVLGRYDLFQENTNDDENHDAVGTVSDEDLDSHKQEAMRTGPMDLYLHGNAASLLYRAIRDSQNGAVRVCVTSTKVDGVVLFPTPNGHSLNYRSSVLHGLATLIPSTPASTSQKHYAMRLLTNHMSRNRCSATYPVASSAIKSVQVIHVRILSASAKVRAANIGSYDPDKVYGDQEKKDVWSGVVPVYEVLGTGIESGVNADGTEGAEQVERWRTERNEREKGYAERAARAGKPEEETRREVEHWWKEGRRRY